MLHTDTAYLSRVGGRKRNEDACGYWTGDRSGCWVVSDGAGGHGGGDRASRIVVSTILERFAKQPSVSEAQAAALIEAAQSAVLAEKQVQREGSDMHATVAVLLIDLITHRAIWAHVGDTRVYLFRNHTLLHQTRDHSLVQSMIDAGYGHGDMSRTHPQRSLLTSAIGNTGEMAVSVSGAPIMLESDDVFLLCSDGWWEHIVESRMQSTLAENRNSASWLSCMAEAIEAHDKDGRSHDNFTAVAIRATDNDPETTILLV